MTEKTPYLYHNTNEKPCIGDVVTSGTAQSGWCSSECSTLVPYAVFTFLAMFFVSLGASPMMVTLTRCVDQEKKSLSLGIANVLTSLLSSIPGPMLYGRLIDQTCLARETPCAGDDAAVTCLVYDNAAFRFYLHGLTNGAVLLGMVFMSVAYLRLRKTDSFDADGRTPNNATTTEGQPMI
ncbi:Solute carrier organic anion transporter family member 4C1 [Lamellibrachia satsuma]|nr:Solute carrier organic anion transporter family member 4C1 [Lamellibrachia satsuma]